ncbi:MAG TPA: metallophosphoesterase [Tissierellia bacterium]|nr:metallophosphoesterase [Tissierellia bacterium]
MKILIIAVIFLIVFFIYNYIQISRFYVNRPIFNSIKLTEELRITQITDYHGNTLIDMDKLLDEIKGFSPHVVVLTGDMIDYKTKDIDKVLEFIQSIYKLNKNLFFVIGNHELRNTRGDEFISKLEDMGVIVLDNENTVIRINEDRINIIGLSFFASKDDYLAAIKGVDDNFTLLLSHSPNRVISYISGIEDLILSGHTHGGQVRLPVIGPIVAPGQGLFPEYDKGTFQFDSTMLYIDSGLGNSVLPIRLFNRVQISNITVKPSGEN